MEPVIGLDHSPIKCISLSTSAPIWQDILAQAMTGELLAAINYASLSEICDDPSEVADALEHAQGERGHAAAFAAQGHKIGVDVTNNVDAKGGLPHSVRIGMKQTRVKEQTTKLFVTQGHNGIDSHRPPSGKVSCGHRCG